MRFVLMFLFLLPTLSLAQEKGGGEYCQFNWRKLGTWLGSRWCLEHGGDKTPERQAAEEKVRKNSEMILKEDERYARVSGSQQSQIEKTQSNIESLDKELAETNKKIKEYQKYLEDRGVKGLDGDGPFYVPGGPDQRNPIPSHIYGNRLVSLRDDVKKIQDKTEFERRNLQSLKEKMVEADQTHKKNMNELLGDQKYLQEHQRTALDQEEQLSHEKYIQTLNAFDDITSLQIKGLKAQQKIDALERAVDRSLTGVYLREKLAKLLASQAFCDAQKNCGSSSRPSSDAMYDALNSVFKSDGRARLKETESNSAPAKSSGGAQ